MSPSCPCCESAHSMADRHPACSLVSIFVAHQGTAQEHSYTRIRQLAILPVESEIAERSCRRCQSQGMQSLTLSARAWSGAQPRSERPTALCVLCTTCMLRLATSVVHRRPDEPD